MIHVRSKTLSIWWCLTAAAAVLLILPAAIGHRQRRRQLDDEGRRVDNELDDSFPASDPPAHSSSLGAQTGGGEGYR